MNGVRPRSRATAVGLGDLRRAEVRRADRAHGAGPDQRVEARERVADRRDAVGPVVPVHVDHVGLQPPERVLDGVADVVGRAARPGPAVVQVHAELGREHDLVASALEHLADELLAPGVAVAVGGVEERDAFRDGAVEHGSRALQVEAAAELVAAEPDDGDLDAAVPERASFDVGHDPILSRGVRGTRRLTPTRRVVD